PAARRGRRQPRGALGPGARGGAGRPRAAGILPALPEAERVRLDRPSAARSDSAPSIFVGSQLASGPVMDVEDHHVGAPDREDDSIFVISLAVEQLAQLLRESAVLRD